MGKPSRSRGLVTRRADGTVYRQDRLFFPRGRVTYRGMPIAADQGEPIEPETPDGPVETAPPRPPAPLHRPQVQR